MKKIFLPLITVALSLPICAANAGVFDFLRSDNDAYWVNNFRRNRFYPINFYQTNSEAEKKPVEKNKQTFSTHEFDRNVVVSAAVGQRMFDSESYSVSEKVTTGDEYQVVNDAKVYYSQNEIKLKKGQKFTPLGEVKINNTYSMLIQVPDTNYLLLVDEKGELRPTIGRLYKQSMLMLTAEAISILPHKVLFEPASDTVESKTEPQTDFELKYDGVQGDMAMFSYTVNGKTEQFMQPTSEKMLEVDNIRIELINFYDDYVEYKILD